MEQQDKSSKMLEKVRALLAKADGTRHEAEAEAFRAKADELMTRYAIETWQVEMAQEGSQMRTQPIRKDFPFNFYTSRNPARDALWSLFYNVAEHCRVKAVSNKTFWDDRERLIPLIGMPQDLEYMDMLFTSLMLQLSQKIDPKPLPELSYEENLAMLKDAGMNWDEIASRMIKAENIPSTPAWVQDDELTVARRRDRMLKHYRAWCKKTGHPQTYHNWQTFRRSFADGFAWEVDDRLREMRHQQAKTFSDGRDSMALAMRDIRELVKEMMYNEFPDMRPHPEDCECETCHAMKCRDPKCDRPRCKARRKPVRYARDTRKEDWAARSAGQRAGRDADLQGHQGRRMGGRKGLPGKG